jgi:U3 small nucleolar RNA-associated protein 7
LHTYFAPTTPKSIDISQKGLLAVASGSKIEIWRDALTSKQVSILTFAPFCLLLK